LYSNQKESVVTETLGLVDDLGILELPEQYETATLIMVYDHGGRKYAARIRLHCFFIGARAFCSGSPAED
jgi:hypothetical protein